MKMCRDPEDAKDVLQDTLLSVARERTRLSRRLFDLDLALHDRAQLLRQEAPQEQVRSRRRCAPRSTATSRAVSQIRRRSADEALAVQASRASARAGHRGARADVSRGAAAARCRGADGAEVARVTGASVQAVKSRLHRARLAVRAQIAPLLGIPTDLPAAPGTCPDVLRAVLVSTSRARSAPKSARRWSGTSRPARAARAPAIRSSARLSLCRPAHPPRRFQPRFRASVKVALRDFLAGSA